MKIKKKLLSLAAQVIAWRMGVKCFKVKVAYVQDEIVFADIKRRNIVVNPYATKGWKVKTLLTCVAHELGHLKQDQQMLVQASRQWRYNPSALIQAEVEAWDYARVWAKAPWWDEEFAEASIETYTRHKRV